MTAPENEITVAEQTLFLDGERIPPTIDPNRLQQALELGRAAILDGIGWFYLNTKLRNPGAEVVRPSMFVTRLATIDKRQEVLTPAGLENGMAIHYDTTELQEQYHPVWHAVLDADFTPEVRSHLSGGGPDRDGVWLMLRGPDT